MYDQDTHFGRSWTGHHLEDDCVCPQQACGLVTREDAELADCPQHAIKYSKTMRQGHPAHECPAYLYGPNFKKVQAFLEAFDARIKAQAFLEEVEARTKATHHISQELKDQLVGGLFLSVEQVADEANAEDEEAPSDVFEPVKEVLEEIRGSRDFEQVGTHYEGCWKYHVPCLVVLLEEVIENIEGTSGTDTQG